VTQPNGKTRAVVIWCAVAILAGGTIVWRDSAGKVESRSAPTPQVEMAMARIDSLLRISGASREAKIDALQAGVDSLKHWTKLILAEPAEKPKKGRSR
jgi:hypothetical protein